MNYNGKQLAGIITIGTLIIGLSYYAGIITGKYVSKDVQKFKEKKEISTEKGKKSEEASGIELTFYEELTKPETSENEGKVVENLKKEKEKNEKEIGKSIIPPLERNKYTVQVASFQKRTDAVSLVNKLKKKGYPAYILSAKVGKKTWFRVRVGEYNSKSIAVRMLKKLERKEKLKGFVTLIER